MSPGYSPTVAEARRPAVGWLVELPCPTTIGDPAVTANKLLAIDVDALPARWNLGRSCREGRGAAEISSVRNIERCYCLPAREVVHEERQ
jgi:hypothetical protein